MEDFRIKPRKDPRYILDVKPIEVATKDEEGNDEIIKGIKVYFGDGIVFNLENNEENLRKIEERQEKQVEEGISNLPKFKFRKTLGGCMTAAGIILGPIAGNALASATIPPAAVEADTTKFFLTIGLVTLGCLIPGTYTIIRNNPKIKQLTKLKFRNDHKDSLNSFTDYPNALAGLDPDKAMTFTETQQQGKNPFSILNVDSYTQEDLERIVENIEREKEFQFVYKKSNPQKEQPTTQNS